MELVSIVIPVYRVEPYLARCMDSVFGQTYPELEIILVDDKSPDTCPALCDAYAEQDSRVRVVHKTVNEGVGLTRNAGLEVASGTYVTFVDSDDWIGSDHIENLVRAIEEQEADMAMGAHTGVLASGVLLPERVKVPSGRYVGQQIIDSLALPLLGPSVDYPRDVQINASSCMNLYRTALLVEHGIRFASERDLVGEDLGFNLQVFCLASAVAVCDENGYFYFEQAGSITRKYDAARFGRTLRAYDELTRLAQRFDLPGATLRVDRTFLTRCRIAMRLIVESEMNRREKEQELRAVMAHPRVREAILRYPIETYRTTIRWFAQRIRKQDVRGVYRLIRLHTLATRLKEKMRSFGKHSMKKG